MAAATAKNVHIGPDNTGLWEIKQSQAAAEKTTELLQKDIEVDDISLNLRVWVYE